MASKGGDGESAVPCGSGLRNRKRRKVSAQAERQTEHVKGRTFVDLWVISMELLGEGLVRVSLDAECLADGEDLCGAQKERVSRRRRAFGRIALADLEEEREVVAKLGEDSSAEEFGVLGEVLLERLVARQEAGRARRVRSHPQLSTRARISSAIPSLRAAPTSA